MQWKGNTMVWKCPVCKNENIYGRKCINCGFDETRDYAAYPTVIPLEIQEKTEYERKVFPWEQLYRKGIERLKTGEFEDAEMYLRQAAEMGVAEAQTVMGALLYGGAQENQKRAAGWFKKAAEQEVPEAEYYFARCCEKGEGVPKDLVLAVKYMRKAADHGWIPGIIACGDYYYHGVGVAINRGIAADYYRRGAQMGSTRAKCKLGCCYFHGEGTELDLGTAAYWFWQAANEDDCEAQALIGMCFEFGYGVKKNLKEAEKWYSLAAEKGDEASKERLKKL